MGESSRPVVKSSGYRQWHDEYEFESKVEYKGVSSSFSPYYKFPDEFDPSPEFLKSLSDAITDFHVMLAADGKIAPLSLVEQAYASQITSNMATSMLCGDVYKIPGPEQTPIFHSPFLNPSEVGPNTARSPFDYLEIELELYLEERGIKLPEGTYITSLSHSIHPDDENKARIEAENKLGMQTRQEQFDKAWEEGDCEPPKADIKGIPGGGGPSGPAIS